MSLPLVYPLAADVSFTVDFADLPIIDLSKTANPEDRLALAQQVCDAMSNHGFFYVVNHGLTPAQVSRLSLSLNVSFIFRGDGTDVRHSRYPFFESQRRREEDICGEDEGDWFVSRIQT